MKYITHRGGTKEDAEDIFQDAITKVIWSIDNNTFLGKAHISTYLFSISKNMWLKTLEKRGKNTPMNLDILTVDNEFLGEIPFSDDDLNTIRTFENLLSKIGEKCTQLLKAVYFKKLSYKKILEQNKETYSSEQAIRNKTSRCIRYLKEGMNGKVKNKENLKKIITKCL
ncbi:sigma-70 family RNA polymerase sigma factor [Flammeovirga sp. EKP202]|nr:sigma-70 family RNA polymerase sigma factor [Flammeovirga sp. EKP202]